MLIHIEIEIIDLLPKERTTLAMGNNTLKNIQMIKILIRYFLLIGQTFQILMMFNVKCDKFVNQKMDVYTTENGSTIKKMEEVFKYGQTDHDTKVNGVTTEQMVTVVWFMQKVTYMKVNGSMTKLMEKERTRRIKEVNIKELGWTINKMDLEQRNGETALDMKACMKME